jgi:hypothetical protein
MDNRKINKENICFKRIQMGLTPTLQKKLK